MHKPIATWSPARDVWETGQLVICGHLAVWSGTWPLSGMTAAGTASGLPTWAHRTNAGGSSWLLPTPSPFHAKNTETPKEWQARRAEVQRRTGTQHGPALNVIVQSVLDGMPLLPGHYAPDAHLPTPTAQDGKNLGGPSQGRRKSPGMNWVGPALAGTVPELDGLDPPGEQLAIPLPGEEPAVDWGPFRVVIERWADVLGRPPPYPAEPNPARPDQLRTTVAFTEWVMGLPEGWLDVPGVTYRQAHTALGNGVVPQQAAAALEAMEVREWLELVAP